MPAATLKIFRRFLAVSPMYLETMVARSMRTRSWPSWAASDLGGHGLAGARGTGEEGDEAGAARVRARAHVGPLPELGAVAGLEHELGRGGRAAWPATTRSARSNGQRRTWPSSPERWRERSRHSSAVLASTLAGRRRHDRREVTDRERVPAETFWTCSSGHVLAVGDEAPPQRGPLGEVGRGQSTRRSRTPSTGAGRSCGPQTTATRLKLGGGCPGRREPRPGRCQIGTALRTPSVAATTRAAALAEVGVADEQPRSTTKLRELERVEHGGGEGAAAAAGLAGDDEPRPRARALRSRRGRSRTWRMGQLASGVAPGTGRVTTALERGGERRLSDQPVGHLRIEVQDGGDRRARRRAR